jgi:hypothetical protein
LPFGVFQNTQIIKGVLVTCNGITNTATTSACTGMALNGSAVRLASTEANLICAAVTGLGFFTASGAGVATPHYFWNGTQWAGSAGTVAPMQNLTCSR